MEILIIVFVIYMIAMVLWGAASASKSWFDSIPSGNDDVSGFIIKNITSPYGDAWVKGAYIKKSTGTCTAHIISPEKDWGWIAADSKEELEKLVAEEYEMIESLKTDPQNPKI